MEKRGNDGLPEGSRSSERGGDGGRDQSHGLARAQAPRSDAPIFSLTRSSSSGVARTLRQRFAPLRPPSWTRPNEDPVPLSRCQGSKRHCRRQAGLWVPAGFTRGVIMRRRSLVERGGDLLSRYDTARYLGGKGSGCPLGSIDEVSMRKISKHKASSGTCAYRDTLSLCTLTDYVGRQRYLHWKVQHPVFPS